MNKQQKKLFIYVFIGVIAVIILAKLIDQWLFPTIKAGVNAIGPFLLGFVVAYLMRFAVNPVEKCLRNITKAKKDARWPRTVSITLVLLLFIGLLTAICVVVIPQLYENMVRLAKELPGYIDSIYNTVKQLGQRLNLTMPETANGLLESIMKSFGSFATDNAGNIVTAAGNLIVSIGSGLFNVFIAFVVAFYLLMDSKRYKHITKRALRCVFPSQKNYDGFMTFIHLSNGVMGRYVSGKLVQTLILTVSACLGFAIVGMDYFLLMGVLVGILNLVPYIGPWIAAVPALVLAMLESPTTALWVGIVIIVLQILDNFVLGPHILGEKLKVSPLWIFVGIIVGGAMFGLPGMLLGAPAVAIINGLLEKFIEYRQSKNADTENRQATNGQATNSQPTQ